MRWYPSKDEKSKQLLTLRYIYISKVEIRYFDLRSNACNENLIQLKLKFVLDLGLHQNCGPIFLNSFVYYIN